MKGDDIMAMNAADIAAWLASHPEFFHDYAEMLAEIQVPHPHAAHSVPLIERQLLLLRDKNRQLASHMRELLRYGEQNDVIVDRAHRMAIDLLRATTAERVLQVSYSHLRLDFAVPCADIRLVHPRAQGLGEIYLANIPELERLGERPYCGPYASDAVLQWFPDAHRMQSFARVALRTVRGEVFGMLALASDDPTRFTSDMNTELLSRIAAFMAAAFERTLEL